MFSDIKNIFKHSSIYGFSTILQKGIGFFMIPVYTSFLTPADYGTIELLDLTINLISMIIGLGLGSGVIRYYHHYHTINDRNELFTTAFILILILNIPIVLVLEIFSKKLSLIVLSNASDYRYFQIILISMALQTIASVPENQLLTEQRSIAFSTISIITLFSYLTLNILFLVVYRMGVMGILLSMLITKILNNIALLIAVRNRFILSFSKKKMIELVKFTLPLVPASIFMFAMHYSDRYFIQKFCTENDLGIYSLGYKFGMMLSVLISQPFFKIWNTKRLEFAKEQNGEKKISRFFTYFNFILIIAALILSLFIDEIIYILTPPKYYSASTLVSGIAIAYILYAIGNFFTLGMVVKLKTEMLSYIRIIASVINIALNYYLIKFFGINGAIWSTILSFMILSIMSIAISQKLYFIKFEYKRLIFIWIIFLFYVSLGNIIDFGVIKSFILKIVLLISFFFLILCLNLFSKKEKENIIELMHIFLKNISSIMKLNFKRK